MNFRVHLFAFLTSLPLLFGSGTAFAQPNSQMEWTERYDKRFLAQDPKIGTVMPEVAAFDADGNPFKLSSTRGKFTVIVFGCLT